MKTELQNKAWACLPKEAREEIRKHYQSYSCNIYTQALFETIFGEYNLTSDTEPEEMLMVERKDIQWRYAMNNRVLARDPKNELSLSVKALFDSLFGDKCLPDKENLSENLSEVKRDLSENLSETKDNMEEKDFGREVNFPTKELEHGLEQTAQVSVQVEPRFKVGDKVREISTGLVTIISYGTANPTRWGLKGVDYTVFESDLEPYTEENENKRKKTKELSLSNDQPTETDPPAAEKTMQRAWCEYCNMEYVEGYVNPHPSDNFVKGYEYGRRDAIKNQWRSVIDKLPEPEQDVFVAVKAGDNYTYGYAWLSTLSNGTLRWYSHDDCLHLDNIKFWIPIPNLPNP